MNRWRRLLVALILAWLAPCGRAGAQAAAACPEPAPAPSPQQLERARNGARDHGFLWRIRKDGHDSYLYGSLHVGKPAWAFPGPALRAALTAADTLALELDISDPATARQLGEGLRSRSQVSADDAAVRQRLQRQRAQACVDGATMQGQPPLLQAIGLTLLAAHRDGLDAAYGQESMLAGAAHAAGKPIVSLERVEQQLDVLLPTDPALARAMLLDTLAQLERHTVGPTLKRLADVWAVGDLRSLSAYAQWCQCADSAAQRALLHRLIDARNPALADAIDALHRDGHRVLAAVGALHMVGPQGLPQLMAQRGYAVQRIRF